METFYRHLLDSLNTAVVMLGRDGCIRYMNPAAEVLFDVSVRRMAGENIAGLLRDHAGFQEVVEDALRTGHTFTRREAQFRLANGKELAADYSVSPLLQDDIRGVVVEIQPRDRLIRIAREEESRSQQEATRKLVRGLAHEIKNPLGGLRGAAQLLERALPDDALQEYTRVIIDEADRLQNLVDRMLGPRQLPRRAMLNIHQVLERIYSLVAAETASGIELVRDYDPSIPDIRGDEEQLIQAVLNVVRNAVDALRESATPAPRIVLRTRAIRQFTLGAERHRLVCQISVIDNGPGVPDTLRETLFYPMISGRANGSGLGLSMAQSIINQHRGLIEFDSEPGRTEFMIFIPLESADEQR